MALLTKLSTLFFNLAIGFNAAMDWVFLWSGLLAFVAFLIYYPVASFKKYQKENRAAELLTPTVVLMVFLGVLGFAWALPEMILLFWGWLRAWKTEETMTIVREWLYIFSFLRLLELSGFVYAASRHFGHKHGEDRWRLSALGHIAVLLAGYFAYRWAGIFLITLPIYATYYSVLYSLALVIVPTSNPDDPAERGRRFRALTSYAWGMQAPMMVVGEHSWKPIETRINGDFTWDFSDFPIPGIKKFDGRPGFVWTKAHQAVGVTGGTSFKRVGDPGIVFLTKLERPQQIFDLRLQLRTNEIEVISKDSISFKVRVFTAFRIDPEKWNDKKIFDKVRAINPFFNNEGLISSLNPSYTLGSFPFSHSRIQATLMTTAANTKSGVSDTTVYWDQWMLSLVEDQARKVVSQKNLNEFWRPANDAKFANALELLAAEIKDQVAPIARAAGILVVVARIVNFTFPAEPNQTDDFSKQQIATWAAEWERKRANIIAEAEAEAEHAQQEARAYAESLLLNSIAEGLQKTQEIDERLPRYVIAMRFLSALQDYVHKNPTDEDKQRELLNSFKEWQDNFFPDKGKEK